MLTLCPNRHLSYASWRIEVARGLWAAGAPYLSDRFANDCCLNSCIPRRSFSRSAYSSKDGRGSNTLKNTRRKKARIFAGKRVEKAANQAQSDAIFVSQAQDQHEEDGNIVQEDTFRVPTNQEELLAFERSVLADTESHAQDQLPGSNRASAAWSPFTEEGRDDLRALLVELEVLTRESVNEARSSETLAHELSATTQASLDSSAHTLQSPIERRLLDEEARKSSKRRTTSKDYESQLATNPWAKMLAGPMRLDSAAKVRLPRELMMNWGIVRDPKDSLDYLMPVDIADLQELRSKFKMPDEQTVPEADREEQPPLQKREGRRIYMQPNSLLTQAMTDSCILVKKRKGTSESSTLSRLISVHMIPWRWKEAVARTETYKRTQTRADETTGKDILDLDWKKDIASLDNIQWQPGIDSRINHILRERLMIALEGLAVNNRTPTAIEAKHIYTMDVPNNGKASLEPLPAVQDDSAEDQTTSVEQMDDQQVIASQPGSFFIHVGTLEQYAKTIDQWSKQSQKTGKDTSAPDYLPALADNALLPPLVTVTLEGKDTLPTPVRLPVFNLTTLFGSTYAERVDKLIFDNGPLDHRFWVNKDIEEKERHAAKFRQSRSVDTSTALADENESDADDPDMATYLAERAILRRQEQKHQSGKNTTPRSRIASKPNKEYMVLVKSSAVNAREFVQEIWQLWRYIGGKNGLWFGEETREKEADDVKQPSAENASRL